MSQTGNYEKPLKAIWNNILTKLIIRSSSYKKLEQENSELRKDIYNLVRKAGKTEGVLVKNRYETEYKVDDSLMFGEGQNKILKGINYELSR